MISYVSDERSDSKVDLWLLMLVLLLSVNPFFTSYRWVKMLLLLFVFLWYGMRRNFRFRLDRKMVVVFLVIGALALIQGIIWEFSLLSLITVFAFEFLIPFYLFKIFQFRFLQLLERAIFGLTAISLVIWSLHELIHPMRALIISVIDFLHPYSSESVIEGGIRRSMMLYTLMYEHTMMPFGVYRNSGFCHEPGGLAVFANLGLFISLISGRPLSSFRNLVYIFAVVSTFSTAGFISLFFILFIVIFQMKRIDLIIIIALVLMPLVIFAYNNLSFMGGKISGQFQNQYEMTLESATTGRLFGARKSLNVLINHPISGRGLLAVSRPTLSNDPEFAAYGWLSEVSRFGLIIGLYGFFLFFIGFKICVQYYSRSKIVFFLGVISLLISLSSQVYLTNPVIFTFVFIALYKKNLPNLKIIDTYKQAT